MKRGCMRSFENAGEGAVEKKKIQFVKGERLMAGVKLEELLEDNVALKQLWMTQQRSVSLDLTT